MRGLVVLLLRINKMLLCFLVISKPIGYGV